MKKSVILLLVIALGLTSCRQNKLRRDQRQYEVVEEGSASGVTSTISALGETPPPPLPALSGTNADTTTSFTITGTTATSPEQPGTIAGTMPQGDVSVGYPGDTRAPSGQPRPRPRPPVQEQQPPPQPEPTTTYAEEQPPPEPTQTDTSATTAPTTTTESYPPPETTTQPPETTTTENPPRN